MDWIMLSLDDVERLAQQGLVPPEVVTEMVRRIKALPTAELEQMKTLIQTIESDALIKDQRITALEAENAELRKALMPFSKASIDLEPQAYDVEMPLNEIRDCALTIGDLINAEETLSIATAIKGELSL